MGCPGCSASKFRRHTKEELEQYHSPVANASGRCPACKDDRKQHTVAELRQYHPRRADFEAVTAAMGFTKTFFTHQDGIMYDSLETIGARVMAWLIRTSWGNQSLYCVKANGEPAFQQDCANSLEIDKRSVSKAMQYYEARGFLQRVGIAKTLYPDPLPDLAPPPGPNDKSREWLSFLDDWKVAHSTDFSQLEVARSTVNNLRKVMRSDYKQWLALRTNRPDIKEESLKSSESGSAKDRSVGPIESRRPAKKTDRPTQPPRGPDDAEEVRSFLLNTWGELLPGEEPSRTLCLQVASIAGDMPLETALPKMKRKRAKLDSYGLALPLIREVKERWNADVHKRAKLTAEDEAASIQRDRKFAREVMKSPDADEQAKAWARQVLGEKEA